jgi:hypothetical protein
MNGNDLMKLVDFINVTWNIRLSEDEKAASYESWNRYVGKFEYNDVMDLIDRHAITSKYPPRSPDIRTRLVDPDLPTDQEAFQQAIALTEAISFGTAIPNVHPLVGMTLAAYRGKITERGFQALWEEKKADYLLDLLNNG